MKKTKKLIQATVTFLFCIVLIIQAAYHDYEYTVPMVNNELALLKNLIWKRLSQESETKEEQALYIDTETVPEIPESMDGGLVFDYYGSFNTDRSLPFVSKEVFEKIKAAYDQIEYCGEFEKGDVSSYDFYKDKYRLLVENQKTFFDRETNEEYLLKDYRGLSSYESRENYDAREFEYYFFDMDGDGAPELVVKNMGLEDIFKYEKEEDRFVLWYSLESWWYDVVGSGKIMWSDYGNMCIESEFYQLDESGNEECITFFSYAPINQYEKVTLVRLPEYTDKSREIEMTEEMKKQGIYAKKTGRWYFRIYQEQYEELEEQYINARMEAYKKREEVTFTYDELFGDDTR